MVKFRGKFGKIFENFEIGTNVRYAIVPEGHDGDANGRSMMTIGRLELC